MPPHCVSGGDHPSNNTRAWRNNTIVGEFDLPEDAEFFAVASNKVPLLAEERDAERKAWARYARACGIVARAIADWGFLPERHERQYQMAKQALRDLGVDVDALLGEP